MGFREIQKVPWSEHSSFSLSKRSRKHLPYFRSYLHLPRIFSAWLLDRLNLNRAFLLTNNLDSRIDFSKFFLEATKSHLPKHNWIEKFNRFSFCLKLVEPDGHRGYTEPVAPHHMEFMEFSPQLLWDKHTLLRPQFSLQARFSLSSSLSLIDLGRTWEASLILFHFPWRASCSFHFPDRFFTLRFSGPVRHWILSSLVQWPPDLFLPIYFEPAGASKELMTVWIPFSEAPGLPPNVFRTKCKFWADGPGASLLTSEICLTLSQGRSFIWQAPEPGIQPLLWQLYLWCLSPPESLWKSPSHFRTWMTWSHVVQESFSHRDTTALPWRHQTLTWLSWMLSP